VSDSDNQDFDLSDFQEVPEQEFVEGSLRPFYLTSGCRLRLNSAEPPRTGWSWDEEAKAIIRSEPALNEGDFVFESNRDSFCVKGINQEMLEHLGRRLALAYHRSIND